MKFLSFCKLALGTTSLTALVAFTAAAETFDIPSGDLSAALDAYTKQTGVPLIIAGEAVKGTHTAGVKGDFSRDAALSRILTGTGFNVRHRLVADLRGAASKSRRRRAPHCLDRTGRTVRAPHQGSGCRIGGLHQFAAAIAAHAVRVARIARRAIASDRLSRSAFRSFSALRAAAAKIQLRW